jgi:uncharacterized membrane protein
VRFVLGKKLRGYFFAGLLVLIPLVLTLYIAWQLFIRIDGLLNEYVTKVIFRSLGIEQTFRSIPGLGLLALIVMIIAVGFVARNYFGRTLIRWSELILSRIPVVRHIYTTFQQISQAFLADHSETFKQAVLFEYPRKGIYSVGFITQDTRGPLQERIGEDVFSIFLPTTPNPTSGFLLFVPKSDVVLLNITVEEALKLVISGGSIVPLTSSAQELSAFQKKLLNNEHMLEKID